jgi:hypothetical protein
MAYENGDWIMHGTSSTDSNRIKTVDELIGYVDKVGFLPLFKNEIDGFSVEEHVASDSWWTGNSESDPWEWRAAAARSKKVAYGKFFGKKAGFIALEWLPYFVNYRRDGYDFDSLYDDGKAKNRAKKIMDLFDENGELFSFKIKQLAGFGKGGEKNFGGVLTELQMQTYLTVADFRYRTNKKGEEYGMSVAIYSKPETLWGYDFVTSAYSESPEKSRQRIAERVRKLYSNADEKCIKKLCL